LAAGSLSNVAEGHRDTVRAALADAFGAAAVAAVTALAVGASAGAILRVETGGRSYLLRVEGPRSPLRYPDQYKALRMAAEAGLAPRVHYVDEGAGVAVTDFIETHPLRDFPGGPRALVLAVAELLRRLHGSPVFPAFVPYAETVLDRHVEHLERLRASYDWDPAQAVSCHNDSLPSNILFDGKRLWLVDWESAYPNDPLVDIAIQLDNIARGPEIEEVLLQAWLGRAPEAGVRDRLAQARALNRLYYAGVLLSASAAMPRVAPDGDLEVPAGAPLTAHTRGKIYLKGFLTGDAVPGLP
jgi:aminoglycoside phosphotransferase (APT) family kinase protein